ncbi:unnamed protein product [Aureobasidium pullulans]|nr:unnamed protein product [Aureobasidium pullulans]CAD0017825.1 unnamed protein product [Aureobasidium pullulans]CAD0053154.1 unnamed protein product [Aureobasidium pullulans]
MHFITSIISLFVASTAAFPTKPSFSTMPVTRDTPGYFTLPINTCVDLPANLTKQVTSFGPDAGSRCSLYTGHCNDAAPYFGGVVKPGVPDLSKTTKNFDNMAESFLCFKIFTAEDDAEDDVQDE